MQFRFSKTAGDSGVIMVVVVIIIMVLSIFSITILSQSLSQSKTSDDQVKQIVAEQLAKGIFWSSYNGVASSAGAIPVSPPFSSKNLNGHTYQISCGSSPGCNQVTITY